MPTNFPTHLRASHICTLDTLHFSTFRLVQSDFLLRYILSSGTHRMNHLIFDVTSSCSSSFSSSIFLLFPFPQLLILYPLPSSAVMSNSAPLFRPHSCNSTPCINRILLISVNTNAAKFDNKTAANTTGVCMSVCVYVWVCTCA